MIRRFGGLVSGLVLLAACQPSPHAIAQAAERAAAAQRVPLTIASGKGTRHFEVEVARTSAEQARGLMYRTSLPKDGGMIFPFSPPREVSFWMMNTLIPLDMIFIRADGSIARIEENATPKSLRMIGSGEPVAAVLEIAGGGARARGIAPGDKVGWAG